MHQTPRDSNQPAEVCIICGTGFDDTKSVCLTQKGATTVLSFTERRGRSDMKNTIEGCLSTDPIGRILVHADCRRDFTDHKRPALATDNDNSSVTAAKQLRSSLSSFNFKDDCFICGHSASTSSKYKDRSKVCRVMTLPLRDNLLALCANRSDSVAAAVRTRLSGCMDLVAAEAVYHALCLTRFELGKRCADITLKENMEAHKQQDVFLSNAKNKTQFISLLSRKLRGGGHDVHNSSGDADVLIVSRAIIYASTGKEVMVVADDTDILVLLLYHWKPGMGDIYFMSEARKGRNVWRIGELVDKVSRVQKDHILFIHAWSGCDTTSATFGHGQLGLLAKIESDERIRASASALGDPESTQDVIAEAGDRLFLTLYSGKDKDTLGTLRFAKFMEMVSSNRGTIEPQKMPPTERTSYFHSLRVHLQIIIWQTLDNDCLDPRNWGWEVKGNELLPTMTDLRPAPENILKFVRCGCKISSKNPCGTNVCTCRKNGLKCVVACGQCRGQDCSNCEEIIDSVDSESPTSN